MIIQRLSASAFLCKIIDNTIFICVYNLDTNIIKEISPTSATPILLTSDIKCVLHAFINTHITIYKLYIYGCTSCRTLFTRSLKYSIFCKIYLIVCLLYHTKIWFPKPL